MYVISVKETPSTGFLRVISVQCKIILASECILIKRAKSWILTRKKARGRDEKTSSEIGVRLKVKSLKSTWRRMYSIASLTSVTREYTVNAYTADYSRTRDIRLMSNLLQNSLHHVITTLQWAKLGFISVPRVCDREVKYCN